MDDAIGDAAPVEDTAAREPRTSSTWVGWSSLFLAFVQSVCAAFAALSGLRLLIGAAAVASAAGVLGFADRHFHYDAIRIPVVLLALVGALFNLAAVWQVWRLRGSLPQRRHSPGIAHQRSRWLVEYPFPHRFHWPAPPEIRLPASGRATCSHSRTRARIRWPALPANLCRSH